MIQNLWRKTASTTLLPSNVELCAWRVKTVHKSFVLVAAVAVQMVSIAVLSAPVMFSSAIKMTSYLISVV